MYKHHEESLENLKNYFSGREEVIAVIFGGSVAKGCERPDSDLDAMVVVTDTAYALRVQRNMTAETIEGHCTYEGGYFDIKYMTKSFLEDAAKKGSEPARNAFINARVLFTKDADIPQLVEKIPIFQKQEKEEKMRSFYADFWLNYYYFLKSCPLDGYMKLHAVNEVLYSIYRMVLQEHEILFPCNRRLEESVERISEMTAKLASLGKKAAKSQELSDVDAFVDLFRQITTYQELEDIGNILSRYTKDFEQWWREPRPNINEW
ncbi:MAG: nucleotidyltransferase domain-containing protein [Lachnospiraceae bacterium]|nr:nucleotidyltransferase domain-containing protein [Lachnospiraceae bacterium]